MNVAATSEMEQALLPLTYAAPDTPYGWQEFASCLNEQLQAGYVQVIALDFRSNAYSFMSGAGRVPEVTMAESLLEYSRMPREADPRWSAFLQPGRQGWFQCHHHIDDACVQNSALYQQILLPAGLRYLSAYPLIHDDRICVALAIMTPASRGPLSSEELNGISALLPHLQRVVRLQRQLFDYSSQAIVGYNLINTLTLPVVLTSLSGELLFQNTAASELAKKTELVTLAEGRIRFNEMGQQTLNTLLQSIELQYLMQNTLSPTQHHSSSGAASDTEALDSQEYSFPVRQASGETLYVLVRLLSSEIEQQFFGLRPLVMLTLYHPEHQKAVDSQLLTNLFQLSQAESRVALALTEGLTPKEIALKHHVEPGTVRKQIQSIYKKTNTHRQSELVSLLLRFPSSTR